MAITRFVFGRPLFWILTFLVCVFYLSNLNIYADVKDSPYILQLGVVKTFPISKYATVMIISAEKPHLGQRAQLYCGQSCKCSFMWKLRVGCCFLYPLHGCQSLFFLQSRDSLILLAREYSGVILFVVDSKTSYIQTEEEQGEGEDQTFRRILQKLYFH